MNATCCKTFLRRMRDAVRGEVHRCPSCRTSWVRERVARVVGWVVWS